MNDAVRDPAFDPRWLERLAELGRTLEAATVGFVDLYLERRLELRFHVRGQARWIEECRTEGSAVRRRSERRHEIVAATGTSPRTIAGLLAEQLDTTQLQKQRPLPPPDLDAPRDWRETAAALVAASTLSEATVTLLERRAAVVRAGGWSEIHAPLLVRIDSPEPGVGSLLATWRHPDLERWAAALPPATPRRPFSPQGPEPVPVVFTAGTAGVLLHELVGHLLEGDVLAAGASPLGPDAPPEIGPPTLSVFDLPDRFDLPGAFSADDEGVAASPRALVEAGAIRGALCDRFSAERLGCPAGRGRRARWSEVPVSRMSNLIVPPGACEPEAIENDVRQGLVVTRVGGAVVDPGSGRAAVRVDEGWELRHGRRRRPLAPCLVGGDVRTILAAIDPGLGNDPTPDWRLGWCVKAGLPLPTGSEAPTMLVRSMVVG